MMQSALTPATLTPAAAPTRAPQRKGANILVLAGVVAWARRGEVTP